VSGPGPTPEQALLLRAAVRGDAHAFAAWRARVRFDDLDGPSYTLVPLLHRRAAALGVDAALARRIANIYKRTWFKNQLLLHRAAAALRALDAVGVPAVVLKGAALALRTYRDAGARHMEDVDLLVRPGQMRAAALALRAAGLSPGAAGGPPLELDERVRALHCSFAFHDADGHEVDLHWNVSAEARWPGADDAFWAHAEPLIVGGAPALALAPTEQLYHVCMHGLASNTPHLRWLADAAVLLESGAVVDWPRLIAHARARRAVLPLATTLARLVATLDAPVPASVLDELRAEPVAWIDQLEHAAEAAARPYSAAAVALRLWCWNRRGAADPRRAWLGFPAFLKRYYRVGGVTELAALGVRRAWARVRDFGLV
jgi:hypothetical protein